ncbi:hypothetical protein [Wenzhouxiangella sediminis]|nr:hypothetical protein [Wenzhouxiangella sediminis]
MKRNTLTTAVLAGLTGMAGMVSVASAVNVNPEGLGQVLLYPYYTARGGNDTVISIVNTTERGKAVKIRFIEALNSREVLDFNIYMSPYDVWTGAVTAEGDGGKLVTSDSTCYVPNFGGEQPFLRFGYAGDGGPQGLERTASGYIEVIEMGTMVAQPGSQPGGADPAIIPWSAKHVNGVPRDCARLEAEWTDGSGLFWLDGGDSTFGFDTQQGASGGLFGSANIINVAEGTLLSYNATAIDGFWAAGDMNHSEPDSVLPDLSNGTNSESFVFDNGVLEQHTWSEPLLALNSALTLDRLMNEYVTQDGLNAQTEWVLTLPTKRFHVDPEIGAATANNPIPPFTRTWHINGDGSLNLPCEDMEYSFWDREEREPSPQVGPPIVSPRPPQEETPQFQLCKEANVIRFSSGGEDLPAATEILKETARDGQYARLGYTNFELPYDAGWVLFDLAQVPADSPTFGTYGPRRQSVAANDGTVVEGLPVIGFQATTYTNGQLGGGSVLANYGGAFNHRGSRSFVSSAP